MQIALCRVINISKAPKDWVSDSRYVYIGRAGHGLPGKYGNPIKVGRACCICDELHEQPGDTLVCYEKWLIQKLQLDPDFLKPLIGKILVCFCKPRPCHGDIICKFL